MERSTFSSSLAPMRGSSRSFCSWQSRSSSSMVLMRIVLENQGDAFRSQALDFQKLERGRRKFFKQQVAPLARAALHNFGQHLRQSFADARNVGDLALRVAQNIFDALGMPFDRGGAVAVAADAEANLRRRSPSGRPFPTRCARFRGSPNPLLDSIVSEAVRYAGISMHQGSFRYCDVSLPVPLDQPFTYALPETLQHRVQPGSRIVVPFGPRKLTGVILGCHDDAPAVATREALRLIDAEPVLNSELLALGRWIAGYYCAPLGEVLRSMLPLASEIRSGKVWSLTDSGRDAARQLMLDASPEDPAVQVLRMLEKRPLSAAYLSKAMPLADKAVKSLERRGFIVAEQVQTERDPLRAPTDRLRVELSGGRYSRRCQAEQE